MDRLCAFAVLAMFAAAPLHADGWAGAKAGAIPSGAIAYGHEADGNQQYVCRGTYNGGVHLGKLARGFRGCNIGWGGREITLPVYEVLVTPQVRAEIATHARITPGEMAHVRPERHLPPFPQPVPATPPDATRKRGFDDAGNPYVDVTLPDGTIKRLQAKGVTLIKPDGTTQFIPAWVIESNVQPPTPPELPQDPALGRGWMAFHNEALLDMIRTLVKSDDAEMKRFTDSETTHAGDDVFKQIAYRTRIASFLAQER